MSSGLLLDTKTWELLNVHWCKGQYLIAALKIGFAQWSVSGKIDKLKELKENVIIGRLIPAGEQYKKIHGHLPEEENEYFDARQEGVDTSESHMKEVNKAIEHESDF